MTRREAIIEAAKLVRSPRCDPARLRGLADASGIDVPRLWHLAHRFLKTLAG